MCLYSLIIISILCLLYLFSSYYRLMLKSLLWNPNYTLPDFWSLSSRWWNNCYSHGWILLYKNKHLSNKVAKFEKWNLICSGTISEGTILRWHWWCCVLEMGSLYALPQIFMHSPKLFDFVWVCRKGSGIGF